MAEDRRPAVSYRRVSTAMQAARGHSLEEDQPVTIARLAARHELEVVAEFSDVASSSTNARRGLLDMLDFIREHHIGAVVAAVTNRITGAQSAQERGALQDVLARQSVVVYAEDGVYDLAQSSQILTWDVVTAVNAHRLRDIRGFIRASHRRSFETGLWRGGWAPFGYLLAWPDAADGRRGNVHLTPIEAEAELVRQALTSYADGARLSDITDALRASGLPTHRGADWRDNATQVILSNSVYAGLLVRGRGRDVEVREARNVTPIVDRELWYRVAERLETMGGMGPRSRQAAGVLAGLVFCGACGARCWRCSSHRRLVRYRCRHALYGPCVQLSFGEEQVVDALLPLLQARLTPEALAARTEDSEPEPDNAERMATIRRQLDRLLALHLRWAEEATAGLPPDEYDAAATPLREELVQLQREAQPTRPEPDLSPQEVTHIIASRDPDLLRDLIRAMVTRIDVIDGAPMLPPTWR